MSMFHIQFPKRHGFLTWDELGCLARALGFQIDLFKSNVTDEISVESDGLLIQEILKMMEYKLLYRPLHQTVNMHTAEWNMTVIRKCLYLLDHRALTFEELHDIRMAYQVYEAADMKGMVEDQRVLLRTLKMCSRTIAPMKLMHRIKHMKMNFEEKGRIQLSEFLDLILWCDVYKTFNPKEMEYSEGKEDELFKLVDFDRLLSHYDERVMNSLNETYLREECGFERENFGTKQMPKEPPVRNQGRIMQARHDKRRYRHLKHEVTASQKRVYRAHAGSIRARPISVPRLDSFRTKMELSSTSCTTAGEAYNSFRKKIRSVPSRGTSVCQSDTFSDRPQAQEYVRVSTPRAVSCSDTTEIEKKMESLKFDMTTMESRYMIRKEEEMDEYIPGYREMIASRQFSSPTPEPKAEQKKEIRWTQDADVFSRPFRSTPAHERKCDARFRGWEPVKRLRGPHFVLVSPFYEPSERGMFFQRLHEKSRSQVQHIKDFDFLYRYTRKSQAANGKGQLSKIRPITAPAALHVIADYSNILDINRGQLSPITHSAEQESGLTKGSLIKLESKEDRYVIDLNSREDAIQKKHINDQMRPGKSPSPNDFAIRTVKSPRITSSSSSSRSSPKSPHSMKDRKVVSAAGERRTPQKYQDASSDLPSTPKQMDCKSNSGYSEFEENLEPYDSGYEDRRSSGAVKNDIEEDEVIPVPPMQHSKPEIVEIGQIGKISLLEKIAESKDLEAKFSQPASPVKSPSSSTTKVALQESEQKNGVPQEYQSLKPSDSILPLSEHNADFAQGKRKRLTAASETTTQAVRPGALELGESPNVSDETKSKTSFTQKTKSECQIISKVMEKENKYISSNNPPIKSSSSNTALPKGNSRMLTNMNSQSPKYSPPSPRMNSKVTSVINIHYPKTCKSHEDHNGLSSEKQISLKQLNTQGNGFKSDFNYNSKAKDVDRNFAADLARSLAAVPRVSYQVDQLHPDPKYWRLVERVNKLISQDLKVRLLTASSK